MSTRDNVVRLADRVEQLRISLEDVELGLMDMVEEPSGIDGFHSHMVDIDVDTKIVRASIASMFGHLSKLAELEQNACT